jgi:putative peptide zinc metalloprotease protein
LLVSVIGLYLFFRILGDARFAFFGPNFDAGVGLLCLAAIPPLIIHELGHALTTKDYGREVHCSGLMLYFGVPVAFVDTTDIWMEGTRVRWAVTWAGRYTGLIAGAICMLVM